jgi:hypothetical protein
LKTTCSCVVPVLKCCRFFDSPLRCPSHGDAAVDQLKQREPLQPRYRVGRISSKSILTINTTKPLNNSQTIKPLPRRLTLGCTEAFGVAQSGVVVLPTHTLACDVNAKLYSAEQAEGTKLIQVFSRQDIDSWYQCI